MKKKGLEYFGTNLSSAGHYRFDISNDSFKRTWEDYSKDLPFNPENLTNKLKEGEVVFYQGGGYTVLGIAGNCTDSRGGTKSIFWIEENLSRSEIANKVLGNALAEKIINQMPFEVNWNGYLD